MKSYPIKLLSSLLLTLLATLPAFGQQSATADVQAAYERYRKAAEAEDLAGIQAAFATDANTRIFFSDENGRIGVAAIVEGYRQWFADCDQIRLSPKNVMVQVSSSGDAAWMTYLEDGSVVSKGRTETWKDIRATIVFSRISGRWLIAHAHWSNASVDALVPQSTREDFKEYCQAWAGRWVGDVTWIMDWPGMGKRGDKVAANWEGRVSEDGHALVSRFYGGSGSGTGVFVYDAAARQIRGNGTNSGGTTWTAILYKQGGKWMSAEKGSHADGTTYEGLYTATISDNGKTHRWSGSTKTAGKKVDELNDVWRRVGK